MKWSLARCRASAADTSCAWPVQPPPAHAMCHAAASLRRSAKVPALLGTLGWANNARELRQGPRQGMCTSIRTGCQCKSAKTSPVQRQVLNTREYIRTCLWVLSVQIRTRQRHMVQCQCRSAEPYFSVTSVQRPVEQQKSPTCWCNRTEAPATSGRGACACSRRAMSAAGSATQHVLSGM